MKALNGKNQPRPDQRRGLLAKIHIAKKELGLGDLIYGDIKRGRYGIESAADLSNEQLEDLVQYFVHLGWQPKIKNESRKHENTKARKSQTEILRERAWAIAAGLENGEKRLQGLVKKICAIERIEWCHDVPKLKRLIAALGKIVNSGQ